MRHRRRATVDIALGSGYARGYPNETVHARASGRLRFPPPRSAPIDARPRRVLTACLVLWTLASGSLRLGSAHVFIPNEAREGVYARAMLDTGDWILPAVPNHVENGEIVPDKPPLFHWIAASFAWMRTAIASGSIPTGAQASCDFDAWALRFPSLACGALMVLGVAVLGRRILGDRAALLAAASLATSWQFIGQAEYGRVDMTMATFVTLSMLWLGAALLDGSRRALLAAATASALAVLGKGPIGLALPSLAGVAWISLEAVRQRSLRSVRGLPWFTALLVGALLALPWYALAYAHAGMGFIRSQLLNENLHQYSGENSRMGFFYYVEPWLTGALPWNLLGLLGLVLACKTHDRRAQFCATWWLVFLLFFQLAAYKRGAYLLPTLAPGAMLCGFWLDAWLPRDACELRELWRNVRVRFWKPLALLCLAIFIAGGVSVSTLHVLSSLGLQLGFLDGGLFGLGTVTAVVALAALVRALHIGKRWIAVVALWCALAGLLHGVLTTSAIADSRRSSPKPLVERVLADLPSDRTVTLQGIGDDTSLLPLFYFNDPARILVVPADAPQPSKFDPGYYLFSRAQWRTVAAPHPTVWREIWTDALQMRKESVPVVFVERLSAAGAQPFEQIHQQRAQ